MMTELTTEQMRQRLVEEERAKRQACSEEVQKLLASHGYALVGVPIIVDGRIQVRLDLVPIGEM